jgi:hypothetical protein
MKKIVFIARSAFYRNGNTTVSKDFIMNLTKSDRYDIFLFWDDSNPNYVKDRLKHIIPDAIIFFEINTFSLDNYNFVYSLGIPICVFLEDTYYITSNTSTSKFIKLANALIFWYKSKSATESYRQVFPNKCLTNVSSRFVNTNIYKNYKLEKKYDILIYGTRNFKYPYKKEQFRSIQEYILKFQDNYNVVINNDMPINFYPLRIKLENIMNKLSDKCRILILPETSILDKNITNIANENLSMLINQSYLTVACPSIADVLMHKFLEIAASNSVILGKYPTDYKDLFEGNMIEVDEFMEDDLIIKIIDDALADKTKLLEMSNRLYKKVHKEYNLDKAVENFNEVMDGILCCK